MSFGFSMPFIPFYFQELGVTHATQLSYYVGLSATLTAAAMAIAAPVWGMVSDRYGRKIMILRAMFFAALILASMGLVQSIWQFMVLRICQGIFTGTITASMSFVSANTPENRLSYSLGLMTSSNFLGWSIGPLVGGLLAEVVGYRLCFLLGGILMIVGFLMVLFLVKEDPNTFGYRVRSAEEAKARRSTIFTPFITAILICLLVQRIARTVFTPFLALYVQETLGTITGAASYTGFINGATSFATAAAALTVARLGDRGNKVKLATYLTLVSIPVIVLTLPFRSLFLFAVFFSLFYFLAGGVEPILTSAASERTPAHVRGILFGIMGTVSSVGAMVSPIMGSYISVEFGIRAILVIIPLFTAIQAICILYARKKIPSSPEEQIVGSTQEDTDMIDMHLHTFYSDGTLSPAELVQRAADRGIKVLAVTDHDGVDGVSEAMEAGESLGVTVIPGIEFSANMQGQELYKAPPYYTGDIINMHILGYEIDIQNKPLLKAVEKIRKQRKERNQKLITEFNRLGYMIEEEDLRQREGQDYAGKPNFALALVKRGYIKTTKEASTPGQFLRHPSVRRIHREKIHVREAISLIKDAGGYAVLAHPLKVRFPEKPGEDVDVFDRLEQLLDQLKDWGLAGMECYYSTHSAEESARLVKMAECRGLLITSGSDFHSPDFDSDLDIGIIQKKEK
jgi:DHA1 family multidrug resistance protein-like MFS transporter